jgi:hypothetical protein
MSARLLEGETVDVRWRPLVSAGRAEAEVQRRVDGFLAARETLLGRGDDLPRLSALEALHMREERLAPPGSPPRERWSPLIAAIGVVEEAEREAEERLAAMRCPR